MATNTDEREEIKPVAPTEQTKWRDPSLVGKYMVDPKTGLAGLFRSPDNGETWVLTDTVYGHVYNQDEVDNIWDNGAGHKVADEIKSATADLPNVRKQADEAVKFAESAIAVSKVNSDAIVAQSSAVVEAKSAMDSATAEIQQTAANAASDAAKIRADVARVQNEVDTAKAANSASVEALKSDIGSAKKDLADIHDSLDKAQSAIEQNQKLINDSVTKITSDVSATKQDLANVHDSLTKAQAAAEQNQKAINDSIAQINANVDATNQDLAGVRKDLTKAQSDITANQKAVNDNVAQINADITQDRKDIASAQQANADTAKQLDTYSKQATEQGKTIKSIQDKQDGFTATIADVQGNVTQVSDKVDGLSASLKDTQGNVASVKAQADQLSATLTDHGKAIATLTASAKELSSTLEDAGGRLSKIEQTTKTNSSTLADVQGDLSRVKQDATTLTATLKDAQGNISMLQQKADSVSAQLATAQGDIATLQTGIAGVKATLVSHDKSIHTLQLDSKSLKDSMADAQGDISTLSKTATSLDSEMKDHAGRLSKVEQNATTQATTLSDLQGNLSQVKQQADGLVTTLKNAQGNITQIQQKADGTLEQLKSAQSDIASLQMDVTGIKAALVSHEGDIHTLQADSKTLKDDMVDAQGNISSLQKSSTKLDSEMSSQDGRLSKVEQTASEQSTTLSDLQGNLSQVKRQADGLVTTLKDAQGNINQIKQDAKGTLEQLSNAEGDITALQKDVSGIKLTIADHDKNIHTLQADSKSLQDDMEDAKGNISTLQKTSTSITSELKDHDGRMNKVEQTASTLVNEFADQQGHLNRVEQKATGTEQTVANQQGQINDIKTDAAGIHETLTGQGNQIASINVTLNGLSSKYEGVEKSGDELKNRLNNLSVGTRNLLHDTSDQYRTLTGDGHLEKSTASDIYTSVANYHGGNYFTYAATITNPSTKNAMLEVCLLDANKNPLSDSGEAYPVLIHSDSVAPGIGNIRKSVTFEITGYTWFIRTYLVFDGGDAPAGSQISVKDERLVEGSMAGTWSPNPADVADKITTNSTQITQNKQAIALKADQSTVDNLSGEVSHNAAQLKVQADQISSKVSSSEYQTLKDKVNGMKVGTRNLLHNTSDQYRTLTGEGWMGVHTSSDEYTSVANYHGGNQFTYAATINNISDVPVELQVWRCDQNKNRLGPLGTSALVQPGQYSMRVSLTGSMDSSTWYLQSAIYSSSGQSGQHTIQVKDERLVEGNIEGTWEANPADIVASIQKNSTAIDQTNKQISLKADQTEVDQIKNTASQNSSRLNVMANEISSKVTSTDVNNIVNSKGYATTSTVQSLVDQKAGTINESITNLTNKLVNNNGGGVNLVSGTIEDIVVDDTANTGTQGWCFNTIPINADLKVGDKITVSVENVTTTGRGDLSKWGATLYSKDISEERANNYEVNAGKNAQVTITVTSMNDPNKQTALLIYSGRVSDTEGKKAVFHHLKVERGSIATPWTPAPSDNATVTQVQQITASIDGLQSRVTNYQNDTSSKYTQLSSLMQSKVGTADFEQLKRSVDMQTLDSADINNMKTNGHYFVHNLANNPIGGWVYVDVTGDGKYRIRQDVYQDIGNQHKYRRWFGTYWTNWDEGATYSQFTQLQDALNLRVQKGELLSQINLTAGNTLIQSNKLYLDASSVVITGTAFIPSAAIASLSADKVNTGWLNTNNVSLGDGRTRIRADHDYMYIQPTGSASSNTGIRMGYSGLDFLTNVIPNGYNSSVPYYSIGYDGASNGYLRISAFDHINSGGATATQNWYTMVDAISLTNSEINFATKGNMHMQVVNGGVNIKPTLFFQNNTNNGTYTGFTRLDNSDIVQFDTGDNNGENFHVNSGARFMQYVYINGYARAQGWLTNSTLSKKTNIRKLDTQVALDKIRQDDQYLYEYKRNVAQGIYDPQASFIIDDVNDVSHYSVPREFIDQSGNYREPNVELAYLIAAFQAIDKQVQLQQAEIKELKEKL